jgi:hypothetical protein
LPAGPAAVDENPLVIYLTVVRWDFATLHKEFAAEPDSGSRQQQEKAGGVAPTGLFSFRRMSWTRALQRPCRARHRGPGPRM